MKNYFGSKGTSGLYQAIIADLLKLLKRLPCSVMLSGYPSRLYDELLMGWKSIELQVMNHAKTLQIDNASNVRQKIGEDVIRRFLMQKGWPYFPR